MLSFIIFVLIASSLFRRRWYMGGWPFMGGMYHHYRRPPMGGFGPYGMHGPHGMHGPRGPHGRF
ncbi:MAG: hypothetical protein IJ157_03010 [Clostridia bacterium]|nr:hypothetical protein [Clostridia bacterium]